MIGLRDMIQSSYVIEALLITVMICICISETISDMKTSTVRNKSLIIAAVIGLILDVVYYGFLEQEYLIAFLLNTITMIIVAALFYGLHIWAAGDSKLLMVAIMLIPSRLYYAGDNIMAATGIMILIFSIAYLYLIGESLYLGVKNKDFFRIQKIGIDAKRLLLQYIRCVCLVTLFSTIAFRLFPDFCNGNPILMMIIDMIIILAGYRMDIFNKPIPLIALIVATVIVAAVWHGETIGINWKIYILVIIVFVLRLLMEKYNYEEIQTENVEPGMVMSYATIVGFMPSRVKNLPKETTEDVRSRITEEEAEGIKRWGTSAKGSDTIIIVRKIPFAVFISIGVVLFVSICLVTL